MNIKSLRDNSSKNCDRCLSKQSGRLSHPAWLLCSMLLLVGVAVDSTRSQRDSLLEARTNLISSLMAIETPSDESSPARGSSGGERQKLTSWVERYRFLSQSSSSDFVSNRIFWAENMGLETKEFAIAS